MSSPSSSGAPGARVIGNVVGSGTAVIDEFGPEHQRTGAWILYTSADSVFQVAAHEGVIPLDDLYRGVRGCARDARCAQRRLARHRQAVRRRAGRVFADSRIDAISPSSRPAETLLDALERAGVPRAGVGKVDDLFAGRGIDSTPHGRATRKGSKPSWNGSLDRSSGLLFANLVDFDQAFGHRNDPSGFYGALLQFDAALPALRSLLREDDLLFITADHGNDPTTKSTDHARECVPLLALGQRVNPTSLGRRATFSDLGATIGEWFGVEFRGRGTSFLPQLVAR